jgi:phosphoribosyl-AMP cyclohydrolase
MQLQSTLPQRARPFDNPRHPAKTNPMDPQLDTLKFDSAGLVPAVIQDHATGQVLVVCYMNRESIEKTIETGKVHTYSRSRGRVALKGESSGHFQHVKEFLTDCDRDAVVFRVEQVTAACHEGYFSCFFRQYEKGAADWKPIAKKVFDPDTVYKK